MRIENDVKLDFKDVLIRPKRSTLNSRNAVDIHRAFRFLHTGARMEGISAHRRQHGRDRHDGDGARARASTARSPPCTSTIPRPSSPNSSPAKTARTPSIRIGTTAADLEKLAAVRKQGAGPLCLHRRRQRLRGKIPRNGQARARRKPQVRDHGRQRRHRRHDGGAGSRRRRHRQDRHRPRLGVHDAQSDRRRLSPAFGDHRMRRRRPRPQGPGLRRRRLHRARRRRQGLWRGRRFRHAGRHARRPRRMRRRNPLRGARRQEDPGRA